MDSRVERDAGQSCVEIVRQLPVRLQELLGYNIRPPFMGYVDGRHPRKVLERDAT